MVNRSLQLREPMSEFFGSMGSWNDNKVGMISSQRSTFLNVHRDNTEPNRHEIIFVTSGTGENFFAVMIWLNEAIMNDGEQINTSISQFSYQSFRKWISLPFWYHYGCQGLIPIACPHSLLPLLPKTIACFLLEESEEGGGKLRCN